MDVEKRMNLSLDAIIKEGSKKGKPRTGRPVGRRGPGKVRVEKLGRQVLVLFSPLCWQAEREREFVLPCLLQALTYSVIATKVWHSLKDLIYLYTSKATCFDAERQG